MQTTKAAIAQRVKAIVTSILCTPPRLYSRTKTFHEMGGDSLDDLELMIALENTFDIEIKPHEEMDITTPVDAETAVYNKLRANKTP